MYAALFEMDSWMGCQQYIFTGTDAAELLARFQDVQDLSCLVRMGRSEEDEAGQKALDVIEEIMDKYYSHELEIEDLLGLDVRISLGGIKCACIEKGDDAAAKLREQYPKAR